MEPILDGILIIGSLVVAIILGMFGLAHLIMGFLRDDNTSSKEARTLILRGFALLAISILIIGATYFLS